MITVMRPSAFGSADGLRGAILYQEKDGGVLHFSFLLTMLERSGIIAPMNTLPIEKKVQVITALVEGNSIRSTVRMTGVAKNTVTKLLVDMGMACADYQDKALRNLPCQRVQCDEIWQFCYAKEKNLREELRGKFGYGDVWTWTAVCQDTKIVPCWHVGGRGARSAHIFMHDLASRLANRIQLTTDGHRVYLEAVESAFGSEVDYAMLVKIYGHDSEPETRYSPRDVHRGTGDRHHWQAGYAERFHVARRTPEFDDADVHAALYPPHERPLQEG
jgi:hypothetical protein